MDILEVNILGRVGQDPVLRNTGNQPVVNLRVATKDRRGDTTWNNVVIFGRDAETAADFLKKGSKVYIRGARPQLRTWEDASGPRADIEYIAGQVVFL